MNKYCIVFTTFAKESDAKRVINTVLENKLVACAQFLNIGSHYVWKNKICHEPEILVLFKTRQNLYKKLESKIKELHPYEIPEIISVDIVNGLQSYFKWIDEMTVENV